MTFQDRSYLYTAREIIVYAPGYGATATGATKLATRYEAVTYDGITSLSEATARASLDIAWALSRSTLHSFTMDIENLEFRRGDLVLYETDILGQVSGRGRVKSLNLNGAGAIVSMIMDEYVDYGAAVADLTTIADLSVVTDLYAPYGPAGCGIRLNDGSIITRQASVTVGSTTLQFTTPLPMPTGPSGNLIGPDTLVVTGLLATVARDVLVWDIAPGDELTADITAVDYASTVFYGA